MKKWLRFIGGSFFLDKYAKEGAKRGFGNVLFAFFMCFIFLFVGLYVGFKSSFPVHYKNSTQINQAVSSIFASSESRKINLKTAGYRTVSGLDGEYDNSFVINTFKSQTDAEKYKKDGFNIVFDTRPNETTYDNFSAYCEHNSSKEKISYEEYVALSENAKNEYTFKIEYSGEALVFGEDNLTVYESHLNRTSDQNDTYYNAAIAAEYDALKVNRGNMSAEKYNCGVYELYFKSYYPDISSIEQYGAAPTIRTWYMQNVINSKDSGYYLCIFDDCIIADFITDKGVPVNIYGYYMKMDGFELRGETSSELKAGADEFIQRSFNGANGLNVSIYFVNLLQIVPLIAITVLLLTVIVLAVCKITKLYYGARFGSAFKIVSSFILMSSVFTAIISIILAFFVSRNAAYSFTILTFVLIMLARCIALMIAEAVKDKLNSKKQPE